MSDIDESTAMMLVDQLSLHKNTNYTTEEKQAIFQDALFISANKAPVAEYNLLRLSQQCSDEHPVAVIKAKTEFSGNKKTNHFKEENAPSSTMFCVGCLVSICGRNIEPKWGLHNGAIGKVIEIVYNPGTSPLHGDFPAYVVVDFKAYCGPAWDADNPMVSQPCKNWLNCLFLHLYFNVETIQPTHKHQPPAHPNSYHYKQMPNWML